MNKVRVGSLYVYEPVAMDRLYPPVGAPQPGQTVRVVNLPGAPKANVMNHCYITSKDKMVFLGLCHVNSLYKVMKNGL